ncbi:hypothetical protein [Candidatus Nitrosotalea okcheonensis]|nr:hypothetical protein [Candidatus Nitrosotalea okcheonensis]
MSKSQFLLALIGVAALVAFTFYTFWSSSLPKAGTKVEPAASTIYVNNNSSVKQNSANSVAMNIFDNKDMPENYYTIQFPTNFKVVHGDKQGKLIARLQQGTVSAELMDVPDNSNLQQYVITQIEPSLTSSLQGYSRINFGHLTVTGNNALDITYTWKNSTSEMESTKTFVEGQDHTMVITSSWPRNEFKQNNPLTNSIIDSFQWLRK